MQIRKKEKRVSHNIYTTKCRTNTFIHFRSIFSIPSSFLCSLPFHFNSLLKTHNLFNNLPCACVLVTIIVPKRKKIDVIFIQGKVVELRFCIP